MKVCCIFSLESPHRGDSEYTQYSIFNIKRKSPYIIPDLQVWDFSKGLNNEFKTAVVNEPSGFKPLKFYFNEKRRVRPHCLDLQLSLRHLSPWQGSIGSY